MSSPQEEEEELSQDDLAQRREAEETKIARINALHHWQRLQNELEDNDLPGNNSAQLFIHEIQSATLDNGKLDEEVVELLRHPEEALVDISNPDTRLSLDLFIACNNASEETYHGVRRSILKRFPETNVLSYYLVKKLVANISGVVSVLDDMCIN